MEERVITPTKLWQGFDADCAKMDISVIKKTETADLTVTDYFFTAETTSSGKLRVYVQTIHLSGKTDLPTLFYIQDYYKKPNQKFLEDYARRGYLMVVMDYCGKMPGVELFSKYPDEYAYANILQENGHLHSATPSCAETCVFVWAKMARKVLTFLTALPVAKKDSIALIGNKQGANIAWQVAAMDKRVKAFVSVIHAGWQEYREVYKFSDDELQLSDDLERWLVGSSVQSYAKFVECPTLLLATSNSLISAIERIEDTVAVMPQSANPTVCISPGSTLQIEDASMHTLSLWLDHALGLSQTQLPNMPKIELSVEKEKLLAKIEADNHQDIDQIVLAYAYGEKYAAMRNWEKELIGVGMNGKTVAEIDVYDDSKTILVFVNVYYKSGAVMSSKVKHILPEGIEIKPFRKSHIIYERKMGIASFVCDGKENFYSDPDSVFLKTGPYDILGVSVTRGHLSNYLIGDVRFQGEEGNLLQFDVSAEADREAEVSLYGIDETGVKEYSARFFVAAGTWSKVSFDVQDFKSKNMQPLKSWGLVKKVTFKDAEGLLINNILWI